MPTAPLIRCKAVVFPICQVKVRRGYCDEHKTVKPGASPRKHDERESAHARGYNRRWQRARIWFLKKHPLCVNQKRCKQPATVVDHITPHRGNQDIFWDMENWQSMCEPCHNRKTATEDRMKP